MTSYDLNLVQGDTFSLTLTVSDVSGNALNLNNYQMSGCIRQSYTSTGQVALNLSGIVPASGLLSVSLPADVTANLPVGIGVYDVKMTNNNAFSFKALQGHVYVNPQVTY